MMVWTVNKETDKRREIVCLADEKGPFTHSIEHNERDNMWSVLLRTRRVTERNKESAKRRKPFLFKLQILTLIGDSHTRTPINCWCEITYLHQWCNGLMWELERRQFHSIALWASFACYLGLGENEKISSTRRKKEENVECVSCSVH